MRPGDTVFVSLVGNDFRHALADGVLTPLEVDDACGFLAIVVTRLREAGMHVIVMGYANPWPGNDIAAAAANALCGMIRRVANESEAKYFDVARYLVMPGHFDGKDFHPTCAGHQEIARAIVQEVNG
jgi:lysophospholipase L1-like esterase